MYRQLETQQDLERVVELQAAIWGTHDIDIVPVHMLRAVVHMGGMVLGAEVDGTLVGFAYALIAHRNDEFFLWSEMAGVHPDHQARKIGFGLKQAQRQWALEHGYDRIHWTFDPMQRKNANFNLNWLGARAVGYFPNFYGPMLEGINAGMDTDRFEVSWRLRDDHVQVLAAGQQRETSHDNLDAEPLLAYREDGTFAQESIPSQRVHIAEIPADVNTLKQTYKSLAKAWQRCLRETMMSALEHGYLVTGLAHIDDRHWYVLEK